MYFKLLPEVSLKLLCYKNLFDNRTEFELDQLFRNENIPCDVLNLYNDIIKYKTIRKAIRVNRLDLVVYFHISGEPIMIDHHQLAIKLNMTDIEKLIDKIYPNLYNKSKTNHKQLTFNHPIKEFVWLINFHGRFE